LKGSQEKLVSTSQDYPYQNLYGPSKKREKYNIDN